MVDECATCSHGDLDFSLPAWQDLTGISPDYVAIQWSWVSCAKYINGTIQVAPTSGVNDYWQAFLFSNSKHPLASVTLNGDQLVRADNNFWQHNSKKPDPPYVFNLTDRRGNTLSGEVTDLFTTSDLGVQFPDPLPDVPPPPPSPSTGNNGTDSSSPPSIVSPSVAVPGDNSTAPAGDNSTLALSPPIPGNSTSDYTIVQRR